MDQRAAQEMLSRTGQMGVPVITVGDEFVVGFDQRRLEALLAAKPKRFGAAVAERDGGLLVGSVHDGSLAQRCGLRKSDLILAVNGLTVETPEQLAGALASPLARGDVITVRAVRDGRTGELTLAPPY